MNDILVAYDVSSLFRNVPADERIETIEILEAFKDDWFNKEYDLNITKIDLVELLEVTTRKFRGNHFVVTIRLVHTAAFREPAQAGEKCLATDHRE